MQPQVALSQATVGTVGWVICAQIARLGTLRRVLKASNANSGCRETAILRFSAPQTMSTHIFHQSVTKKRDKRDISSRSCHAGRDSLSRPAGTIPLRHQNPKKIENFNSTRKCTKIVTK